MGTAPWVLRISIVGSWGGFEKRRLRDMAVQSRTEETSQVPVSHRPYVPMGHTFHIFVSLASKYLAAVAHCLYHTPSFCPNEGVNDVQLYTCLFLPLLCPMTEQCCGRIHKPRYGQDWGLPRGFADGRAFCTELHVSCLPPGGALVPGRRAAHTTCGALGKAVVLQESPLAPSEHPPLSHTSSAGHALFQCREWRPEERPAGVH